MRALHYIACLMFLVPAACGAKTGLRVPTIDASIADDGAPLDDGVRPPVILPPMNIDCSLRENCNQAVCRDNPVCAAWVPGGCPVGQVHDAVSNECRSCTAQDCDGLPSFCCMTRACSNAAACGLYVCAPIAGRCHGLTSTECGVYDIDQDDAWGDCDEAVQDACCSCHVALGCFDSPCPVGTYVTRNDCAQCTSLDCDEISCMGLNGCSTNCPPQMFFDGAHCRACTSSDNASLIPACMRH